MYLPVTAHPRTNATHRPFRLWSQNTAAKIALLQKALAIVVANPGEEERRSARVEFYKQRLETAQKVREQSLNTFTGKRE